MVQPKLAREKTKSASRDILWQQNLDTRILFKD